jgi:hypothetical protein
MIIGTITLITILFLGGTPDYYLVSGLEKGVKQYVIEKERKKDILDQLARAKKEARAVFKSRKALIKELKTLNADRSASREELNEYEQQLLGNVENYQKIVLDARLEVVKKITEAEWTMIMKFSEEKEKKEKEIFQEKLDKGKVKDPFTGLEKSIQKNIRSTENRTKILRALDGIKKDFGVLSDKLSQRNGTDTPILRQKDATKDELMTIAEAVNEIRRETFHKTMEFRSVLLENTTDEEWGGVVKEFNNLWE